MKDHSSCALPLKHKEPAQNARYAWIMGSGGSKSLNGGRRIPSTKAIPYLKCTALRSGTLLSLMQVEESRIDPRALPSRSTGMSYRKLLYYSKPERENTRFCQFLSDAKVSGRRYLLFLEPFL